MQLFTEYEYTICNNAGDEPVWCPITRNAALQVAGAKKLWILEQKAAEYGDVFCVIEQYGKRKDTGHEWHTSHTLVVVASNAIARTKETT